MNEARNVRSTSRREALLDAVIESVAEHGYERASLRDIASRADMTHVGLLRHFPSKSQLLLAALDDQEQRERREIATALSDGASDADALALLLGIFTRDHRRARDWLSLAVASSDPANPAHEFFRRRQAGFKRVVADFAKKPTTGNVGVFDPETRATLLLAVVDGLRLQWLIDPEIDVAAAAARFTELLLPPQSLT